MKLLLLVAATLVAMSGQNLSLDTCKMSQDTQGAHVRCPGAIKARTSWFVRGATQPVNDADCVNKEDCKVPNLNRVEVANSKERRTVFLNENSSFQTSHDATQMAPAQSSTVAQLEALNRSPVSPPITPSPAPAQTPAPAVTQQSQSAPTMRSIGEVAAFKTDAYARLNCRMATVRSDPRPEDGGPFDFKVLDTTQGSLKFTPACDGIDKFDPAKFVGYWWLEMNQSSNRFNDSTNLVTYEVTTERLMELATQFNKNPRRASWYIGVEIRYLMPNGDYRTGSVSTPVQVNIPDLPPQAPPLPMVSPAQVECPDGRPFVVENIEEGPGLVLTWFFQRNCQFPGVNCEVVLKNGNRTFTGNPGVVTGGRLQIVAPVEPGETLTMFDIDAHVLQYGQLVKICPILRRQK